MSRKEAQMTEQEASLLKRMQHPNIVTFMDSFVDNRALHIVMEFADGGDLDKWIKDFTRRNRGRTIPEKDVLGLFLQLSLAIKYIHDRKILHRDLKAQNVFLTSKGILKLGDFGVSRVLRRTVELAATQIGTPYYMSPEIMNNQRYNSKTDIWSLGVMLYELMCQRLPFQGRSMRELCNNIIKASPAAPPTSYSKDLRELVRDLLLKNPKVRPGINSILGRPVMRSRVSEHLGETLRKQEFSHTVLHGRDILRQPPAQAAVDNAAKRPVNEVGDNNPVPKAAAIAVDRIQQQRQAELQKQREEQQREQLLRQHQKKIEEQKRMEQQRAIQQHRLKVQQAEEKRKLEIFKARQQAQQDEQRKVDEAKAKERQKQLLKVREEKQKEIMEQQRQKRLQQDKEQARLLSQVAELRAKAELARQVEAEKAKAAAARLAEQKERMKLLAQEREKERLRRAKEVKESEQRRKAAEVARRERVAAEQERQKALETAERQRLLQQRREDRQRHKQNKDQVYGVKQPSEVNTEAPENAFRHLPSDRVIFKAADPNRRKTDADSDAVLSVNVDGCERKVDLKVAAKGARFRRHSAPEVKPNVDNPFKDLIVSSEPIQKPQPCSQDTNSDDLLKHNPTQAEPNKNPALPTGNTNWLSRLEGQMGQLKNEVKVMQLNSPAKPSPNAPKIVKDEHPNRLVSADDSELGVKKLLAGATWLSNLENQMGDLQSQMKEMKEAPLPKSPILPNPIALKNPKPPLPSHEKLTTKPFQTGLNALKAPIENSAKHGKAPNNIRSSFPVSASSAAGGARIISGKANNLKGKNKLSAEMMLQRHKEREQREITAQKAVELEKEAARKARKQRRDEQKQGFRAFLSEQRRQMKGAKVKDSQMQPIPESDAESSSSSGTDAREPVVKTHAKVRVSKSQDKSCSKVDALRNRKNEEREELRRHIQEQKKQLRLQVQKKRHEENKLHDEHLSNKEYAAATGNIIVLTPLKGNDTAPRIAWSDVQNEKSEENPIPPTTTIPTVQEPKQNDNSSLDDASIPGKKDYDSDSAASLIDDSPSSCDSAKTPGSEQVAESGHDDFAIFNDNDEVATAEETDADYDVLIDQMQAILKLPSIPGSDEFSEEPNAVTEVDDDEVGLDHQDRWVDMEVGVPREDDPVEDDDAFDEEDEERDFPMDPLEPLGSGDPRKLYVDDEVNDSELGSAAMSPMQPMIVSESNISRATSQPNFPEVCAPDLNRIDNRSVDHSPVDLLGLENIKTPGSYDDCHNPFDLVQSGSPVNDTEKNHDVKSSYKCASENIGAGNLISALMTTADERLLDPLEHTKVMKSNIGGEREPLLLDIAEEPPYSSDDAEVDLTAEELRKYLAAKLGPAKVSKALELLSSVSLHGPNGEEEVSEEDKDEVLLNEIERIIGHDKLHYLDDMFQLLMLQ